MSNYRSNFRHEERTPLAALIAAVTQEKNIDEARLTSIIERAMEKAAKQHYRDGREFRAEYNKATGHVDLYETRQVVETIENDSTEITLSEAQTFQ